MKKLAILTFTFLLSFASYSQSFDGKGDKKFDMGYDVYGHGNGINLKFDYGLSDLFSVGLGGAYFISNHDYDFFIYARTAIHLGYLLDFNEKFDIYPGVNIGYLHENNMGFAGYLGLRYFFNESFGMYAEFGSTGSLGLSYTF